MKRFHPLLIVICSILLSQSGNTQLSKTQLARWFKQFPEADANGDGKLSVKEALAYRKQMLPQRKGRKGGGVQKSFKVDPGWKKDRFPDHAVSYKSPKEIADLYGQMTKGRAVVGYEKPLDGSLRIVGTGHSFMAPGYQTFPVIAKAAGLMQPPLVTNLA